MRYKEGTLGKISFAKKKTSRADLHHQRSMGITQSSMLESASGHVGTYSPDISRSEPPSGSNSPKGVPRLNLPVPEIPKRSNTIIDAPFFYGNPVGWPGERE